MIHSKEKYTLENRSTQEKPPRPFCCELGEIHLLGGEISAAPGIMSQIPSFSAFSNPI
jgi:hypothetical protein